jgi:hypothetical protein
VNAPWKETAVIYGLLDLGDTAQYIRVERIYQNDGMDAIKVAQIGDSLYFDTATVELIAKNGNSVVWTEVLSIDNSITKDTGQFATSPSTLYKTTRALNKNLTYEIKVKTKKTPAGKEYTSTTAMVGASYISSRPNTFVLSPTRKYTFTLFKGNNAVAYDVKVHFRYREYDSLTNDSVEKTLDWIAVNNLAVNGSFDLYPEIVGRSMYDFLGFNIKPKAGIYRKIIGCEFLFIGGGEQLLNYININKPSLGIVQKKPEYTNINNGLGLFSSRNTTKEYILINDSVNYFLTVDPATKNLGFRMK